MNVLDPFHRGDAVVAYRNDNKFKFVVTACSYDREASVLLHASRLDRFYRLSNHQRIHIRYTFLPK